MGGLPTQMAEYNTHDSYGTALDLSARRTTFSADGKTTTSKAVLTLAESAAYTIDNVLSGDDSWDADYTGAILSAPVITVADGIISWKSQSSQTMCYLVIKDGIATLTTDNHCQWNGKDKVTVQCVSPNGVLGLAASVKDATGINTVGYGEKAKGDQQEYTLSGLPVTKDQSGLHVSKGHKRIVK